MRLVYMPVIGVIVFTLLLSFFPAVAEDCGCDFGWDGDSGPSDSGDDSSTDSGSSSGGDSSSSEDSWDVTDSSWYSDIDSGGSSSDSSGSSDSWSSSDSSGSSGYSGSSGNSGDSGSSSASRVGGGSVDDAQGWLTKARDYYDQGLYNESLAAFNASLSMDPYSKPAWMGKGEVLMRLGYYETAEKAYQRVIKLDPAEYMAYFMSGEAWFHTGSYEDAIAMYDRALAVNPLMEDAARQKDLAREAMAMGSVELDEEEDPASPQEQENVTLTLVSEVTDERNTTVAAIPSAAGMAPIYVFIGLLMASALVLFPMKAKK
ncbi:MAG TPA: tetratricopeptide repeat protein [Methanoregulaceae archaeon]|nr:tetratricopeptide repeat protein [Methanoregulaceae archaeon]